MGIKAGSQTVYVHTSPEPPFCYDSSINSDDAAAKTLLTTGASKVVKIKAVNPITNDGTLVDTIDPSLAMAGSASLGDTRRRVVARKITIFNQSTMLARIKLTCARDPRGGNRVQMVNPILLPSGQSVTVEGRFIQIDETNSGAGTQVTPGVIYVCELEPYQP